MRVARLLVGVADLRLAFVVSRVKNAIALSTREGFRVVHYSVQHDHLHFILEANDASELSRGTRALAIRIAHAVNGVCGRKGKVFGDRYHARALRTPREVRLGILYVLMNHKKHIGSAIRTLVDRCSSGIWWSGFRETPPLRDDSPLSPPRTWLLREGWLRAGGKLSVKDVPRLL
jgi:hypothetical protein